MCMNCTRQEGQFSHLGNDGHEGGKGQRHWARAMAVGGQRTDSRLTKIEEVTGFNWMMETSRERDQRWQ